MNMDLSEVIFSRRDVSRKIQIPKTMNEDLAELIGACVGDGNICTYPKEGGKNKTSIDYSGHALDDISYYNDFIIPKFNKTFNIKPRFNNRKTWFYIRIYSLAIFTFYTKIIKLPVGKKATTITIPKIILTSTDDIIKAFLRGIYDTDGTITFKKKHKPVHHYPVIKIELANRKLIEEIKDILEKRIDIKTYTEFDKKRVNKKWKTIHFTSTVYINGKERVEKWMKLIGFNNPKHMTKYLIWKKFGFCPPYTTFEQRKQILEGYLNPHNLY